MADNDPTPTPTPVPAPTPAPTPDPKPDPDRTFTQAELDRIVQDRLVREQKKYEGFDDLKAKAAKLDEIEAANATELEKMQLRAEKAEADSQKASARAKETAIRSAIVAEAAKPDRKVIDPNDVVTFLTGPDAGLLELDADGNPKNVAEAMDSLLKAKPHLVGGGNAQGSAEQGARGGGANQVTREQLKTMSPQETMKAEKEGRLESILSGA